MATIHTKHQLEAAKNRGDSELLIEGELASELHKTRALARVGPAAAAIIIAASATAPFTFGVSLVAAAALTGAEIALIILAVALGLTLVLAVWWEYEEVEFDPGPPPRLRLRRRPPGGGAEPAGSAAKLRPPKTPRDASDAKPFPPATPDA
jgi:hypothetical protein